ncbi:MAG: hypothetical protein ABIN08_16180 [Caldimonas sp.]
MYDLKQQLDRSYGAHPDFRFADAPFEVDADRIGAFNDGFDYLRTGQGALTPSQFGESRTRCQRELDAVFDQLKSQSSDELERRFLVELHAECRRLVGEELKLYARRPSGRGIALGSARTQRDAVRLRNDCYYFGSLPRSAVDEMMALAKPEIEQFRLRAAAGQLTREHLSSNVGQPVRDIIGVLNREYRLLGVIDAVSAYMGHRMVVGGLALELSVPQANWWTNAFIGLPRAPNTLYAHLDESIVFPKSIVYLSDVTPENGPTSCYRQAYRSLALTPIQEIVGRVLSNVGNAPDSELTKHYAKRYHQSMSSEGFRRHFMRLPESMRFNSHFGWDVLPDSEAEQTLAAREDVMVGPAGTFIVFDGAKLLHRGGMVRQGDRVALQVVFAASKVTSRIAGRLRKAFA